MLQIRYKLKKETWYDMTRCISTHSGDTKWSFNKRKYFHRLAPIIGEHVKVPPYHTKWVNSVPFNYLYISLLETMCILLTWLHR